MFNAEAIAPRSIEPLHEINREINHEINREITVAANGHESHLY